ncbi:KAP family NTPase [Campylobacter sp. CNRCH_2015_0338h]|uniref:KAP family P-loop NTPase fold protein n=1 Tax=Campylobacter sp. CNRCH_2015_0338h TaxID=2911605 RepID=UPI0021E64C8A|nr:KAP family NTPase [Campylobacter sp. CNRCH_2015_0338h]MCV3472353.1 KAP family NTPase [Campylobacter sp. CNRCH_2015_0338h]
MQINTFKVDKAITSKNEDLFDRKKIAIALARTIKYYKDEDSISMGIIGDWGSGKTSFINMVLEDFKDDENFIIINFNPWNISTRKQLKIKIKNLKKICSHAKNKFFSKVPQKLEDLALLFKMSSYVIADPVTSVAMSKTSNAISDFNKLLSAEKKGLDEIKNKINTALSNIDTKIIIVIDDLDRLADTDIREIFQLVRSIADFKNTMYILAYDNEIVTKALDKIQKDKGERYIEKIVQVPIVLPKLNKANLTAIFMQKIEQFSFTYEKIDKNEFIENLNTNNFAGAFENIRDINRYLNVLKFEMSAIKQELYLYDFAVITLFKVFEPKFYEFIYNHFEIFAGTALASYEIDREEQKSIYTKMIDKQIESLNKLNKKVIKKLLISIFPKIYDLHNRDFSDLKDRRKYKHKHRIASLEYFQDYFVLNFAENVIRKETIDKIIKANSHQEYDDIFNEYDLKELEKFKQLPFKMSVYAKDFKSSEFIYYLWGIFDEIYGEVQFFYFEKCKSFFEFFSKFAGKENINTKELLNAKYPLDARMLFIYSYNFSMKQKEYFCEKELKVLLEKLLQEDNEKVKEKIKAHIYTLRINNFHYLKNTFKIFAQNSKIFFLILEIFIEKDENNQKYINQNLLNHIKPYELKTMIEETFKNPSDEQKEIVDFYKDKLSHYKSLIQK